MLTAGGREMKRVSKTQREKVFLSLPREERETIISHGTAIRLSNLKKQLLITTLF